MTKRIVIVDYGVGNLYSVRRAVEVCGGKDILVSDQAEDVLNADKLILPGVGAFEDGMKGLRERGLIDPIINAARSGTELLGICLGMQLLASHGEEFGIHQGLSLIPGTVKKIPTLGTQGEALKIPFIGWANLKQTNTNTKEHRTPNILNGKTVYLVHSYHFVPEDQSHITAVYEYTDLQITAAIKSENITGVQFHPEKSGEDGLNIIKAFLD